MTLINAKFKRHPFRKYCMLLFVSIDALIEDGHFAVVSLCLCKFCMQQ
jgi:hypothetical protein